MSGRHRKPWLTRVRENRKRKSNRTEVLEDLMDQVTELVRDCEDEFEGGTTSAEDTVHKIANLLELY